ncbi:MAG: Soluble aldose sugar dehydrogenase YliI precursor, partial [Planctomycetota bacterium]
MTVKHRQNIDPQPKSWSVACVTISLLSFLITCSITAKAEDFPRWTSSRLKGSPEPPLPYRVRPAYPALKFNRPVLIEKIPGTHFLVVGEVTGQLVAFEDRDDASTKTLVADLKTANKETNALYGLAFHPDFLKNRLVYVCYVVGGEEPDGTRVSEFQMTSDLPPRLLPESERNIIRWKGGGHNGGALAFGPDGMLYISTGDATGPSPPDILRTGQDVSDLLSSLLRIDVSQKDGELPYAIPEDNPFVDRDNVRPEIWAYGLRNPWKFSFDQKSGDLWLGDVGWELWELVHLIRKGGNYGWSAMEGRQSVLKDVNTGPSPISPPVLEHPHSEAASITGGYVYYGKSLPELAGKYVYGDFQSGFMWSARWDGVKIVSHEKIAETGLRLVSFGLDHSGELLLLEHDVSNAIYRLEKQPQESQQVTHAFPEKLSQTGLFRDIQKLEPESGVRSYRINAQAWADGATSLRHMAIPPDSNALFDSKNQLLRLAEGSVLAKTILMTVPGKPEPRRMETQILLKDQGAWSAYSYVWNEQQTDAVLAPAEGTSFTIAQSDLQDSGKTYQTRYRVSSRSECLLCHNPWAELGNTVYGRQSASPLALSSAQLDHTDELRHQEFRELVDWALGKKTETAKIDPSQLIVASTDTSASTDRRVRSWLHVNCSMCHAQNAGGAATIILDESVKTSQMRVVNVRPLQGDLGLGSDAAIIKPGFPEKSVLFARIAKHGSGRMPRLGSSETDIVAARQIYAWIKALGAIPQAEASPVSPESSELIEHLAVIAKNPAATDNELSESLQKLLHSPSGALAVSGAELAGITPRVWNMIVDSIKPETPPEIREFLERLLPRSKRVERLGQGFSP